MYIPFSYFFRKLSICTSLLVLISVMATGCGSSGDGEVVDIPGDVPNLLNYAISQETGTSMIVTQNPSATVTSAALTGTFNRTTQEFTLNAQTSAVMAVSASEFLSSVDNAFSDYQLRVTTTATWVGEGVPTAGAFEIISGDQSQTIAVSVSSSIAGVDISTSPGGDSSSLTWEEFDNAFGNTNLATYEQIAAFAYGFLRVIYEQGGLVILTLEFIGENSDVMELSGTIVENCDTVAPLLPSETLVDPGTSMVSWSDVNNDQSIGTGDMVFLDFLDCWDDDPADDLDTLYRGGIVFSNYVENQTGTTITRVGFESAGGTDGINFTGLRVNDTSDDGTNLTVSSETISLTGGFSMVFTAP